MTELDDRLARTLEVADGVVGAIERRGGLGVLIGGMALAVHRYPRDTVDLNLATAVPPAELYAIGDELRAHGYGVEIHPPDTDDPLGGVVDVHAAGADLVQIVNFLNPPGRGLPRLVAEAALTALSLGGGSAVRVVDLPHLIVFKLYAGGRKSALDILELLDRNPELDRDALRALCATHRLDRQLDAVLGSGG